MEGLLIMLKAETWVQPHPALPSWGLTLAWARPWPSLGFSLLFCTIRVTTPLIHIFPITMMTPLAQLINDRAGFIFS